MQSPQNRDTGRLDSHERQPRSRSAPSRSATSRSAPEGPIRRTSTPGPQKSGPAHTLILFALVLAVVACTEIIVHLTSNSHGSGLAGATDPSPSTFDNGGGPLTLGDRIATAAESELGYRTDPSNTYCNKFSAFLFGHQRLQRLESRRGMVRRLRRLGVAEVGGARRLSVHQRRPQLLSSELLRMGGQTRDLAPCRFGLRPEAR